jgi:flagellar hook-basal body complex protein FliE
MNEQLATKVKEFVKVAISQVEELENKVAELEDTVENYTEKQAGFSSALEKAAKALCDSDFITDDKGEIFIKKAQENPAYLAKVIEKLCEASDVMTIGRPSSVSNKQASAYDPVMARAFGRRTAEGNYELLDDTLA